MILEFRQVIDFITPVPEALKQDPVALLMWFCQSLTYLEAKFIASLGFGLSPSSKNLRNLIENNIYLIRK